MNRRVIKLKGKDFLKISVLMLVSCIGSIGKSFAQNTTSSISNSDAVIIYQAKFTVFGQSMSLRDSLLVRGKMVLEPIKIEQVGFDIASQTTNQPRQTSTRPTSKLQYYYLTDVSRLVGMGFDVDKTPTTKNIKTYTAKTKGLGYGLTLEPFFFDDGYTTEDYALEKDTTINGKKCFILKADKVISVVIDKSTDKLLYTRITINPQDKNHSYSFISEKLAHEFGGAILRVESKFKSGLKTNLDLRYISGFTNSQSKLFDKYKSLYDSNRLLLENQK